MGVRNFFPWLASAGYLPDKLCFISVKHSLLVDVKTFMYRYGYSVPIDEPEFCKVVADAIVKQFRTFERVVFANDGKIDSNHPKFETAQKRSEARKKSKRKNEQSRLQENLTEFALEKLDRSERAARGVSFEQSISIMQLLSEYPNFTCVQCDAEADDYIAEHHSEFDFVVSQDSDFIVAGVACLVCNMGTPKQAVFRTSEILEHLDITQTQLQEISALAGNDYTLVGIRGMSLQKAYTLIRHYGNCRTMLVQWTQTERAKMIIEPSFYELFNRSMLTYCKHPVLLDVPPQPQITLKENSETNANEDVFLDLFMNKRLKNETVQ